MKVLMFGWELPPSISGGLGTACQGIVEGLAGHGVKTRFVLPRAMGEEHVPGGEVVDASTLPSEVEVVAIPSSLEPYRNAETYEASGHYGSDLGSEVARYAGAAAKAAEGDFDVVHAHDWMTFPAAIAAAKALQRPLIVHIHSCEFDRAGPCANETIVRVEQAGMDAADRIVCVSAYTARKLRERYDVDPDKIRVVHNAILQGPKSRHRRPDPVDPMVLFLGRLTQQKAPERFLEAAARVIERVPETRFVMAGDGDMRTSLEASAKASGTPVEFPGFLGGPAVRQAFEEASVFVMPSVSEPFGLVALEAMDSGVPVVVTRTSGVAEAVESALKVDSDDVDALADRVLAVLRHPALADELVTKGRAEVARLTWARQTERLKSVYDELVGGRGG